MSLPVCKSFEERWLSKYIIFAPQDCHYYYCTCSVMKEVSDVSVLTSSMASVLAPTWPVSLLTPPTPSAYSASASLTSKVLVCVCVRMQRGREGGIGALPKASSKVKSFVI